MKYWFKDILCFISFHKWLPMPRKDGFQWCDWCLKIRRTPMNNEEYWFCVIGPVKRNEFPKINGFDAPPRISAINAIEEYGIEVKNCWSGWGISEEVKNAILLASHGEINALPIN